MNFTEQLEASVELAELRQLLVRCRTLLALYGAAHAGGMTLTEWHKKRIELMERIAEVAR